MSQLYQSMQFTPIRSEKKFVGELSDLGHDFIPVQVTLIIDGKPYTFIKKETQRDQAGELVCIDYFCPEIGWSLALYND